MGANGSSEREASPDGPSLSRVLPRRHVRAPREARSRTPPRRARRGGAAPATRIRGAGAVTRPAAEEKPRADTMPASSPTDWRATSTSSVLVVGDDLDAHAAERRQRLARSGPLHERFEEPQAGRVGEAVACASGPTPPRTRSSTRSPTAGSADGDDGNGRSSVGGARGSSSWRSAPAPPNVRGDRIESPAVGSCLVKWSDQFYGRDASGARKNFPHSASPLRSAASADRARTTRCSRRWPLRSRARRCLRSYTCTIDTRFSFHGMSL